MKNKKVIVIATTSIIVIGLLYFARSFGVLNNLFTSGNTNINTNTNNATIFRNTTTNTTIAPNERRVRPIMVQKHCN